jgi:uncharacterized membrane protein
MTKISGKAAKDLSHAELERLSEHERVMMSQNRQAARDRIDAEVDHEVNVRAELAIRQLDMRLRTIEERLTDLARSPEHLSPTAAPTDG